MELGQEEEGSMNSEVEKQLLFIWESLLLPSNSEVNIGAKESDSRGGPAQYPSFLVASD